MCNLRPPFHPSFCRALPKVGTVTDLILSDVFVNNIHDLRRILCAFPHLRHLTIGHISYSRPVSSTGLASCKIPEISVPCRARLQTLSLDWGSDYHLFVCLIRWLIDASVCTDLTSFEVMSSVHPLNGRFMIYDYLDLLMESIGPSVRRLVVAPEGAYATCCYSMMPNVLSTICLTAQGRGLLWLNRSGSLRHCPNLRVLSFRLSDTSWKGAVEELLSVFTSMCSPYIEEIGTLL